MGNNVDLIDMLGLPETVQCPHCTATIKTGFDDHDIECGTEYDKGNWEISLECLECEKDFNYNFKIQIVVEPEPPGKE